MPAIRECGMLMRLTETTRDTAPPRHAGFGTCMRVHASPHGPQVSPWYHEFVLRVLERTDFLDEANAVGAYKQMIVDCDASEIVYTNLFTGVHGNYLRPSIVNAGLDPDALPESDASAMGFGGGEIKKPKGATKAWRDVWGCGQGIGPVRAIDSTTALVQRLEDEYEQARLGLDLMPGVLRVRGRTES